jgi:hypothetical protein
LILPTTDEQLRMMATNRTMNADKPRENTLTDTVERVLTNLLCKEIDYQRRTEALKEDLNSRFDFSVRGSFNQMDTMPPKDKIDRCEIRKFVDENLRWLSEFELDAIIRRSDTDGDEALSYVEFSEIVRGIKPELSKFRDTKGSLHGKEVAPLRNTSSKQNEESKSTYQQNYSSKRQENQTSYSKNENLTRDYSRPERNEYTQKEEMKSSYQRTESPRNRNTISAYQKNESP